MAGEVVVHECGCAACRAGEVAMRDEHRQLNVLLSRLNEQQRRLCMHHHFRSAVGAVTNYRITIYHSVSNGIPDL